MIVRLVPIIFRFQYYKINKVWLFLSINYKHLSMLYDISLLALKKMNSENVSYYIKKYICYTLQILSYKTFVDTYIRYNINVL